MKDEKYTEDMLPKISNTGKVPVMTNKGLGSGPQRSVFSKRGNHKFKQCCGGKTYPQKYKSQLNLLFKLRLLL
jgi:hypothetical protein